MLGIRHFAVLNSSYNTLLIPLLVWIITKIIVSYTIIGMDNFSVPKEQYNILMITAMVNKYQSSKKIFISSKLYVLSYFDIFKIQSWLQLIFRWNTNPKRHCCCCCCPVCFHIDARLHSMLFNYFWWDLWHMNMSCNELFAFKTLKYDNIQSLDQMKLFLLHLAFIHHCIYHYCYLAILKSPL